MDHARLRPTQVGASTAAAVGGAFLATRLGIYGTIIGVGVITLMSTVGSEMLLRSLERTKQAARTANPRLRVPGAAAQAAAGYAATSEQPETAVPAETPDEAATLEQPATATLPDHADETLDGPATAALPDPAAEPRDQPAKARRWPIVAGGFVASFGLALAVIAGIEAFTGQSLDGEGRPTVINVIRGDHGRTDDGPSTPLTPTDEPTRTPGDGTGTTSDSDSQRDGTAPNPEPSTPAEEPAPQDDETPAPQDEEGPVPEDSESPPEDETPTPGEDASPPPSDEETPPPDEEPTPAQ